LVGAVVVVLYGIIPTFQADPHFGRVYAAYGRRVGITALT